MAFISSHACKNKCVILAKYFVTTKFALRDYILLHKFYECSDVKEFMQWELILREILIASQKDF